MKSINLYIKENVMSIGKDVYLVNPIVSEKEKTSIEKKLNNAIKAFNCEDFYQSILAIQDGTLFGSSKEGFVFTGEKMIHHNHGEFKYSEIESVEYIENKIVNEKGKEKLEKYVLISKNNEVYKFQYLIGIDEKKFAEFLNTIINDFDEYVEEDLLKVLEDMPEELKIAYLKTIVNMTYIDDEEIDEKELAELLLLMTRLSLTKESRFNIRAYITELSKDNMESVENLLGIIRSNSESSHFKPLMISLAKDLINVYFSTKETVNRNFEFLDKYKKLFELSDKEVELAYDTVENDYKLIKENLDNNAMENNMKKLGAQATAAGVPLAAVYLSGSVVGMSAAGISSGLAFLGMGLGMTGGIAMIGIISIVSYEGLKKILGANEIDKYKTRELMLHEVIKQTQKTISLIIDDINYVVQKLNDTILNHSNQTEKIKKLTFMIAQFQAAMKNVDQKGNQYQNAANQIHCPKELDVSRLESLTEEPTQKPLFNFIIDNYEEKYIEIDGKQKKSMKLKENIDTEILEKMGEIFKSTGYFDMGGIMKGKASEGLGKIKKGIFG